MFTRDDAHWLSLTVGEIYTARTIADLARAASDALDHRFSLLASAVEEVGVATSGYALHRLRTAVPAPRDHAAYLHDNPFSSLLDRPDLPPLLHMRGRFSFDRWRRTDHFNGIARPMGWTDQLMLVGQREPNLMVVSAHRDGLFSAHEVTLMSLLQPHVAAGWRRVHATQTPLGEIGRHSLRLDALLAPLALTAAHRELLRSYFPGWRPSRTLPAPLADWIAESLRELQGDPPLRPLRAFAVESTRGRLAARCFPGAAGVELFLIETPASPDFRRLRHTGLTARECEILHWLAQGKRDSEIAAILGIARATVSKHVENLLRKLAAPTRAAAVHLARERLRSPG